MGLGSTQPLTEMSTRNHPGGKGRPARETDNFTANCEPVVWKMWEPQGLTTLWAFTARYRDSFTFYLNSCSSVEVLQAFRRKVSESKKDVVSILKTGAMPSSGKSMAAYQATLRYSCS
jgi:hypothetical protein